METKHITTSKKDTLRAVGHGTKTLVPVVVTERDQPPAEAIPFSIQKSGAGKLSDTLVFEKDTVSPLGEDPWNACR